MLGKLLKYELKSSARLFIPLYIALMVVSIFAGMTTGKNIPVLANIIPIIVMTILFAAMIILTFVVLIQRFRKNLLSDEGYLMFTLPVNTKKIVISKGISSLIYVIISVIVSFLVMTIYGLITSSNSGIDLLFELKRLLLSLFSTGWLQIADIILMVVELLLGFFSFIFLIYLSLSLGQLPVFNKHRNLVAVVAFFVISFAVIFIQVELSKLGANRGLFTIDTLYTAKHFYELPSTWANLIWNLVLMLVYFFCTIFILDNKLNLE